MIRVVSGHFKGKRLKKVSDLRVRPMPDKLKESLFNILQDDVRGRAILDGFAGTGSVGIEALSRGARAVVFVEEYYPAVKVIRDNLSRCGVEDGARVLHKEFNRAVIQLSKEGILFDLIFLDPPYKLLEERDPLKVIEKRGILGREGRIILRHHKKVDFQTKHLKRRRRVEMGDDVLAFFTY